MACFPWKGKLKTNERQRGETIGKFDEEIALVTGGNGEIGLATPKRLWMGDPPRRRTRPRR